MTTTDEIRASAEETLRGLNTRNSSDSLRSDYEGMLSETAAETAAREQREMREQRANVSLTVTAYKDGGIEVTRHDKNGDLGLYGSVIGAVEKVLGSEADSTGHPHWVAVWDKRIGAPEAAAIRDGLVRRGWDRAEFVEEVAAA